MSSAAPSSSSSSSSSSSADPLVGFSSSPSPAPSPAPSEKDVDVEGEAEAIEAALSQSLDDEPTSSPVPPPDDDLLPASSSPTPAPKKRSHKRAPPPPPVDPSIARATGAKLLDDLLSKATAYMSRSPIGAEIAPLTSTRPVRGKKGSARMSEKEEDDELLHALEDDADRSSAFVPLTEQPASITGKMRPYQLEGLNWMIRLYDCGVSGILADEMGLGKTLQSISLLAYLRQVRNVRGPPRCPHAAVHAGQLAEGVRALGAVAAGAPLPRLAGRAGGDDRQGGPAHGGLRHPPHVVRDGHTGEDGAQQG